MKFASLQQLARAMDDAEAAATLRQLCADPRFAAVVKLLADEKDIIAESACALKFADHHGCLAHAAGGRCALAAVEGRLRQLCDPPISRTPKPPSPTE